MTAQALMDEPE